MIGVVLMRDDLIRKRFRMLISQASTSSMFVFLPAALFGGDLRGDGSNYGRLDSFMM